MSFWNLILRSILNAALVFTPTAMAENRIAASDSVAGAWNSLFIQDQTHWTDETGATVQLKQFSNSPAVIMTAFYTHCNRTCPELTFKALKKIEAKFQSKGEEAEFLLVSLEPEIDTPAILTQFKNRIAPHRKHWHLLRADSDANLAQFVKEATLSNYWKMDDHTLHDFKILYFDGSKKAIKTLDFKHREMEIIFGP